MIKTEQAHAVDIEAERQLLLEEVREVLKALRTDVVDDACWCPANYFEVKKHTEICQHTRDLMKKLSVNVSGAR